VVQPSNDAQLTPEIGATDPPIREGRLQQFDGDSATPRAVLPLPHISHRSTAERLDEREWTY
jgi:hypothetical protein